MPNGKWRFSEFYKAGGATGHSIHDINNCTLWEFMAVMDGWKVANGVKTGRGADLDEDQLIELGIEGF